MAFGRFRTHVFRTMIPRRGRSRLVAVVDHDPARLEATARSLADLGCTVIGFSASDLALEQIPSCACEVDVVLDAEGATLEGGSLAQGLRTRFHGECPRLVLAVDRAVDRAVDAAGGASPSSPAPARGAGYDAVMAEPVGGPELVAALDCVARRS